MELLTKNETALSAVITETAETALNSAVSATSFQTALSAVLKIKKYESKQLFLLCLTIKLQTAVGVRL